MRKLCMVALVLAGCSGGSAISVDELVKKNESETLKAGEKVTVKGLSWGVNGMVGGGKRLNLGQVPLEGMKQAPVVADWDAASAAKLPELAKNAPVKVECTVDEPGYAQVRLKSCSLL
jgi:hypothetical protein